MSTPTLFPSTCVYAVKLLAMDPKDPTRIAGRLEHVLSGRRHDFDDGVALLACLAHEQLQAARAAGLPGAANDPHRTDAPAHDLDPKAGP